MTELEQAIKNLNAELEAHQTEVVEGRKALPSLIDSVPVYDLIVVLAEASRPGYVRVPREPTEAMIGAAANLPMEAGSIDVYRAMLAAIKPEAER